MHLLRKADQILSLFYLYSSKGETCVFIYTVVYEIFNWKAPHMFPDTNFNFYHFLASFIKEMSCENSSLKYTMETEMVTVCLVKGCYSLITGMDKIVSLHCYVDD